MSRPLCVSFSSLPLMGKVTDEVKKLPFEKAPFPLIVIARLARAGAIPQRGAAAFQGSLS